MQTGYTILHAQLVKMITMHARYKYDSVTLVFWGWKKQLLVHIVALVFVLAEGQIVSADHQYFLRNVWQRVQKENNKTFKADGSLDQLQIQPNIRMRSQEKVKEEHYRGTPTTLSSLKNLFLIRRVFVTSWNGILQREEGCYVLQHVLFQGDHLPPPFCHSFKPWIELWLWWQAFLIQINYFRLYERKGFSQKSWLSAGWL